VEYLYNITRTNIVYNASEQAAEKQFCNWILNRNMQYSRGQKKYKEEEGEESN
jgi:hypothetical protein